MVLMEEQFMKQIIFGGFCMLTSIIGISTMLYVTVNFVVGLSIINMNTSLVTYLNWLHLIPVFVVLCIIGIVGFIFGLWGVFVSDIKKKIE